MSTNRIRHVAAAALAAALFPLPAASQTGPDLHPDSVFKITPDGRVVAGATVYHYSVGVRNYGTDAPATTLRHYWSLDEDITTDDRAAGTSTVPPIAADTKVTVTVLDLRAPLTNGTWFFGSCVDVVEGETDTSNQCSPSLEIEVYRGDEDTGRLTARFHDLAWPREHSGKGDSFTFQVQFSEPLGAPLTASAFKVKQGRIRNVQKVGSALWRVRVRPRTWRDVTVDLPAGAVSTADNQQLSKTVSARVPGPPRLEVSGGRVREGKRNAAIDFTVTLNRIVTEAVTVDYRTEAESAQPGSDYVHTSGTLRFAPFSETEKTVSVRILDDDLDEGREKFQLVLSNAQGGPNVMIRKDRGTGQIRNTDPAQAAWLSRFGRAVATAAVDAVGNRIDRSAQVRRSGSSGTDLSLLRSFALSAAGGHGVPGSGMAGYRAGFGGGLPGHLNAVARPLNGMAGLQHGLGGGPTGGMFGNVDPLFGGGPPLGPTGAGHDMALPTGSLYVPGGDGGRWTGWAQTSVGHFSGSGPGTPVALSGQMRMGVFGTDYRMGRVLAGVAVAHGRGGGSMRRAGLDRAYGAHSTLTSVHPYVAFDLSEELTVWGQGGWGRGEMALAESFVRAEGLEQAGGYRTGNGLTMMAAGVRGGLPELGGFELAVKSDAFLVRTVSDAVASRGAGNLAAAEAGVSRVRAALEGSRELRFAGGRTLTPSVELGVRQDGGDAETGMGLDTGFGVVYADPNLGLMVDATLNLLVAHQDSRYEEWGFTGSVRFDPGLAGRGLSLTMTPSFGMASQGADRLWAMQDMSGLVPHGALPVRHGWPVRGGRRLRHGGTGRPRDGDAVRGPDAVGRRLPGDALWVAVDGGPTVQRGGRGRAAGRLRRDV